MQSRAVGTFGDFVEVICIARVRARAVWKSFWFLPYQVAGPPKSAGCARGYVPSGNVPGPALPSYAGPPKPAGCARELRPLWQRAGPCLTKLPARQSRQVSACRTTPLVRRLNRCPARGSAVFFAASWAVRSKHAFSRGKVLRGALPQALRLTVRAWRQNAPRVSQIAAACSALVKTTTRRAFARRVSKAENRGGHFTQGRALR